MSLLLHTSLGTLLYSNDKLIVEIDKQITDYYLSLLPKHISFNRQMYAPHISVVRNEDPLNKDLWSKYQGKEIEFYYSPAIHFGQVYFWLNVFCKELENIRQELGLPVHSKITIPPEGFLQCFHTTLGNFKNLC